MIRVRLILCLILSGENKEYTGKTELSAENTEARKIKALRRKK